VDYEVPQASDERRNTGDVSDEVVAEYFRLQQEMKKTEDEDFSIESEEESPTSSRQGANEAT